jgi:hypothetical protein
LRHQKIIKSKKNLCMVSKISIKLSGIVCISLLIFGLPSCQYFSTKSSSTDSTKIAARLLVDTIRGFTQPIDTSVERKMCNDFTIEIADANPSVDCAIEPAINQTTWDNYIAFNNPHTPYYGVRIYHAYNTTNQKLSCIICLVDDTKNDVEGSYYYFNSSSDIDLNELKNYTDVKEYKENYYLNIKYKDGNGTRNQTQDDNQAILYTLEGFNKSFVQNGGNTINQSEYSYHLRNGFAKDEKGNVNFVTLYNGTTPLNEGATSIQQPFKNRSFNLGEPCPNQCNNKIETRKAK